MRVQNKRDVRFSYTKNHINKYGYIFKSWWKSAWNAGYYLHLEPNNCFFAQVITNRESDN
ncbi:MAG: DUF2461 family protein [Bacteroidetes bacterium]|nr:DUF2461 family protein [Bacteroidota bacterium]